MRSFAYSWITEQSDTVLSTTFPAFVLHGHKDEECIVTAYGARGDSVHILGKLLWCVMETFFLVDTA